MSFKTLFNANPKRFIIYPAVLALAIQWALTADWTFPDLVLTEFRTGIRAYHATMDTFGVVTDNNRKKVERHEGWSMPGVERMIPVGIPLVYVTAALKPEFEFSPRRLNVRNAFAPDSYKYVYCADKRETLFFWTRFTEYDMWLCLYVDDKDMIVHVSAAAGYRWEW